MNLDGGNPVSNPNPGSVDQIVLKGDDQFALAVGAESIIGPFANAVNASINHNPPLNPVTRGFTASTSGGCRESSYSATFYPQVAVGNATVTLQDVASGPPGADPATARIGGGCGRRRSWHGPDSAEHSSPFHLPQRHVRLDRGSGEGGWRGYSPRAFRFHYLPGVHVRPERQGRLAGAARQPLRNACLGPHPGHRSQPIPAGAECGRRRHPAANRCGAQRTRPGTVSNRN